MELLPKLDKSGDDFIKKLHIPIITKQFLEAQIGKALADAKEGNTTCFIGSDRNCTLWVFATQRND